MNHDDNSKPFIERFPHKSFIIVSNREPYIHKKTGQYIKVSKPAGGLTSAMDEVLNSISGKWVAWGSGPTDKETVDNKDCIAVPPNKPRYTLKRVWLTPQEINNYYHGYSNHVLWPLCHITLDRVYFRKGHTTRLHAFPISVDYKKFNSFAFSPRTVKTMEQLKARYNLYNKYIGIGVDRLEYTKGLIKRFQAIDLFFDRYPEYRGKFTFIQITVPTRIKEPYISYRANLEKLISEINRRYSTSDWNPIIYRDTKAEHEDLVAYYRMADVAIISSIYDGMNLVAKEFVASQIDMKGVLLLSEFAGAAEELDGAISVNPYDIEEFSDCIKKALSMPEGEKHRRMKTLRMQVKERDIYRWISDVLGEIALFHSMKPYRHRYIFDHLSEIRMDNIFLFLDYDGTITPIVSSPDKAILSDNIRSLILKLKEKTHVAIVSGRELDDIKNWLVSRI